MHPKHILPLLTMLLLSFFTFSSQAEAANTDVKVFINNKQLQFAENAKIVNGLTMVPLRETMEALGSEVKWNQSDKVTITKGNSTITLQFGNKVAYQNGVKWVLDTAPFVEKGRTFVPLRFISEGFQYEVKWNNSTRSVNILDLSEAAKMKVKVPILMYHDLGPGYGTSSRISPEIFREQMIALKNQGYTTINDADLLDYLEGKRPLPEKPIMITFDDGYRSNYIHAYPVLKELRMKATVYLITSRVVTDVNHYPNEIPKFSWDEARKSQDVFSFQSHTHDLTTKDRIPVNSGGG